LAYEYGYNSDGVRVWKRDVLNLIHLIAAGSNRR
jgi:hypothetical protein